MRSVLAPLGVLACVALAFAVGCKTAKPDRAAVPPAESPDRSAAGRVPVERVDYADSDAFDLLLETALINTPPVILVQTDYAKPEWGARLNEWIAAWNSSRRSGFGARGQIPTVPSVVIDGESIREFRFLIDGLMGRVEESARVGGHWWVERHTRDRRVALLRPYSLRFHLGKDGHVQLIFFHADHAARHKDMIRSLADPADEETLDWFPGYCCSLSKE